MAMRLNISNAQLQKVAERLEAFETQAATRKKLVEDLLAGRVALETDNRISSEARTELIVAMTLVAIAPEWEPIPGTEEDPRRLAPLYK